MSLTKDQLILLSKIQEQAERYDDMKETMKKVALTIDQLSVEDRNLLSVAYKNCASDRRKAYRVYGELEAREIKRGGSNLELITKEKFKIENELSLVCNDLLGIITSEFINKQDKNEAKVFFLKMAGDYHRYMCEYLSGEKLNKATQLSLENYKNAEKIAVESLESTNPIRLGLILNLSVFYFEIMKNYEKAIQTAKDGFDTAIANIEALTDEEYKDATTIMQLIRDNLTLWSTECGEEAENA
jgi:14-3-3 protein epsilon